MTVYIFENSYYIGEDEGVIANALRFEKIEELEEGKVLSVTDGALSVAEEEQI
jgi:F420-0:gamma-glutamyl ligase-like protein